jgi:threonine synthase
MAGVEHRVEVKIAPTIAEGTAISEPVRLREVLGAIRRSGGRTVAVTEEEIAAALVELARLGLYVEPTCATVAAAFLNLMNDGIIKPGERTVLLLTGTGLKSTPRWADLVGVNIT